MNKTDILKNLNSNYALTKTDVAKSAIIDYVENALRDEYENEDFLSIPMLVLITTILSSFGLLMAFNIKVTPYHNENVALLIFAIGFIFFAATARFMMKRSAFNLYRNFLKEIDTAKESIATAKAVSYLNVQGA